MKTAIITGITGQDGAYLAKLLLQKEYHVIGLTRSNKNANLEKLKYLNIHQDVEVIECDLTDISSIINIINSHQPSEIYNLAAQSSVGLSFSQPIGTIHFNIVSVLNILEAMRISKKNIKFYQASSSEMYGAVEKMPVRITTPMHPLSPYAISKASAYWIVVNYRESYGLYACNGVLFNHESYLRSKNFFIKKVISEAVSNRNNINWTLKVGNLDVRRDFGYSPDYVKAMWLMLQEDIARDFIICSGKSILLRDIVNYIFQKLDIPIDRLEIDPELFRPTDINDIYGDNSDAKAYLNLNDARDFFHTLDILIEEEMRAPHYQ
jgi:GDPmannose 4,6-dehydratase